MLTAKPSFEHAVGDNVSDTLSDDRTLSQVSDALSDDLKCVRHALRRSEMCQTRSPTIEEMLSDDRTAIGRTL